MTAITPSPAGSAEERLDAAASERLDAVPADLGGAMWDPAAIAEAYLPILAWAHSLDEWNPGWDAQTQRAAIRSAVSAHRLKGTAAGVRGVLDRIGAVYDYTERPSGPFTASVQVYNSEVVSLSDATTLRQVMDAHKRGTVHMHLGFGASLGAAHVGLAAAVAAVQVQNFTLEVDGGAGVPAPNRPPTARAGDDRSVRAGSRVMLDGRASVDVDGTIVRWAWTQTAGATVALDDADTATPEFEAPMALQRLAFRLVVTDDRGGTGTDTVDVVVRSALPPRAYRLDTLAALGAFGTYRAYDHVRAGWAVRARASTGSAGTGPGTNSAGPYVYLETSAGGVATIKDDSIVTLRVVSAWPATSGRVLRLRCSIAGDFRDAATEGLRVEGRTGGGAWTFIALVRGWAYSNTYRAGDRIVDAGGGVRTCVADGGWVDVDTDIPDAYDAVRLRVVAAGSVSYRHDVALFSADLRE